MSENYENVTEMETYQWKSYEQDRFFSKTISHHRLCSVVTEISTKMPENAFNAKSEGISSFRSSAERPRMLTGRRKMEKTIETIRNASDFTIKVEKKCPIKALQSQKKLSTCSSI